ncbi:MAG: FAD-dependent monooxygenase, partial [Methylococcaceae bacterium]|nr:FAD-dependent monooxygenase [Methylococcaceae bacterium]
SHFRVHHRVADRYRAGHILIAGDAAHVHSPAGGQGMNTGIQDAFALGHALASVISGQANESLLDGYERQRRPVALRVVGFTDRMTRVATLRGHWPRALRNLAIGMVGRVPAVRKQLAFELAELGYR